MKGNKSPATFQAGKMQVKVFPGDREMGQAAARHVAEQLRQVLKERDEANLILATGASQFTFLDALKDEADLGWKNIRVFHLDEYVDMSEHHPASFRRYLRERILNEVKPGEVHFIRGDAEDLDAEIARYERLLERFPTDVACIGIGENGHIAFNDPPVADFDDPHLVKVVELDEHSRKQQLGEGWFESLEEVPRRAITLTIPAMMSSDVISCVVPDKRKAAAVRETITGEISTACPATVLREHSGTMLYLDRASASGLPETLLQG